MSSIFSKQIHPFKQLIVAILFAAVIMLIAKGLMSSGSIENNPNFYWEICLATLLSYALFNCIFSLTFINRKIYFPFSILSYVLLAISGSGLAHLLAGLSINEAGSIKWLLFVFAFAYLVFISIINLMKLIMDFAQRQDAALRGEE